MLSTLLRHTLLAADARALALALASGAAAPDAKPFDVAAQLGAVTWPDNPVLTHSQRDALTRAPALSAPQLRAAEAVALALLGVDAVASDAKLARIAASQPAFAPDATVGALEYGAAVVAMLRETQRQRVLCLTNASAIEQLAPVPWRRVLGSANVRDLVSGARLAVHGPSFALAPYDVRWLVN